MEIQHQNPITIAFPPCFTNFTISVFKPIAAIAITIKNLLDIFISLKHRLNIDKTLLEQKVVVNVVNIEANKKYKMNVGKIF